MDEQFTPIISEAERLERRRQRSAARRKKQLVRRRQLILRYLPAAVLVLAVLISLLVWAIRREPEPGPPPAVVPAVTPVQTIPEVLPPEPEPVFSPQATAATVQLADTIDSSYAVLLDLEEETILAQKAPDTIISPASMTKVLTLLVAVENLTEDDLDEMFTMTIDITDYCYVNECSVVGLMVGEQVSVRELLYGTILPSGADAALGLATYIAGSHEAFVEMMNQKLEELELSDTAHFTNCVGLYDEAHLCSIADIAAIMAAAMENDLCREILNARTYETIPTTDHPDGQILSNWFLRRIEDSFTEDFQIIGGKTGYVVEAGSCAVSVGRDANGKLYICATGDASGPRLAIQDHTQLYQTYCR